MLTTHDVDGLAAIPHTAQVSVATGTKIVHISGQTGVDEDDMVVGTTLLAQATRAFANLKLAAESLDDPDPHVAMLRMYVVDYSESSVDDIAAAAFEVFGEGFPVTASTLIGVAALWRPELLFEVDAVLVLD